MRVHDMASCFAMAFPLSSCCCRASVAGCRRWFAAQLVSHSLTCVCVFRLFMAGLVCARSPFAVNWADRTGGIDRLSVSTRICVVLCVWVWV